MFVLLTLYISAKVQASRHRGRQRAADGADLSGTIIIVVTLIVTHIEYYKL